jgi:hypothetical protein
MLYAERLREIAACIESIEAADEDTTDVGVFFGSPIPLEIDGNRIGKLERADVGAWTFLQS